MLEPGPPVKTRSETRAIKNILRPLLQILDRGSHTRNLYQTSRTSTARLCPSTSGSVKDWMILYNTSNIHHCPPQHRSLQAEVG